MPWIQFLLQKSKAAFNNFNLNIFRRKRPAFSYASEENQLKRKLLLAEVELAEQRIKLEKEKHFAEMALLTEHQNIMKEKHEEKLKILKEETSIKKVLLDKKIATEQLQQDILVTSSQTYFVDEVNQDTNC